MDKVYAIGEWREWKEERKEDGVEEKGGKKDGKLVLLQWVHKAGRQLQETSDGRHGSRKA